MWSLMWSKVVDFFFEDEELEVEFEMEDEEDLNDYEFMNHLFN